MLVVFVTFFGVEVSAPCPQPAYKVFIHPEGVFGSRGVGKVTVPNCLLWSRYGGSILADEVHQIHALEIPQVRNCNANLPCFVVSAPDSSKQVVQAALCLF